MGNATPRDRAAASFYGIAAGTTILAAIVMTSLVLVCVAIVFAIAAIGALRSYPVDRVW